MPGIKGQKWSTEKRRPTKKCNVAIPEKSYQVLLKLADKHGMNMNQILNHAIQQYIGETK